MASAVAAYCRVSALPTTFVVKIVLTPDPVGGTPQIVASYGQTGQLAISSSPGGGNGLSTPLNPGDWIGVSFDGTLIKGWTAVGGAGFTTSLSLATPGGFPAPSGFYAILQIIDTVASVSAFGAQLLPGADITAPIEHGHGAC